jgi:predicted acylesterase/phospholipase RssA
MHGMDAGSAEEIARSHRGGAIDRREALRRLGLLGLGTVGASALLTACSSDSSSTAATTSVADKRGGKKYRMLSFCGGGIRGLISAGVLQRLTVEFPNIVADADALIGCSVGGSIVSSLLAGQTAEQIYQSTVNDAPKFYANPGTNLQQPAFDTNLLIGAQQQQHPTNPKLKDLEKTVMFATFNVGSANTPWKPIMYNNFPKSTNADTTLIDAVMSSGVMPSEEASYKGNVDGAFLSHDPTVAAIALAVDSGVKCEDIVVITFGTGFMANWIASDTSSWGQQQWQNGDGNAANQLSSPLYQGTLSPVLSMAFNGTSTNLVSELSAMLLPGRHAYMNPVLDRLIPEYDTNPTDLQYMQQQTADYDISPAVKLLEQYW